VKKLNKAVHSEIDGSGIFTPRSPKQIEPALSVISENLEDGTDQADQEQFAKTKTAKMDCAQKRLLKEELRMHDEFSETSSHSDDFYNFAPTPKMN